MSKRTRKARAAAAQHGTAAADAKIDIISKIATEIIPWDQVSGTPLVDELVSPADIFTGEELATMPLLIRKGHAGCRTKIRRSADGTWWRRGGDLYIREIEGRRCFVIYLWKGATKRDLDSLRAEVDRTRVQGRSSWVRSTTTRADEKTLWFRFAEYACKDPFTHVAYGDRDDERVFICTDSLCTEKTHYGKEGRHVLDAIYKTIREGVTYEISVVKDVTDSDDRGWYIDLCTDEFYGTPNDVSTFVNDLQWMREECRRANEPELNEILASESGAS